MNANTGSKICAAVLVVGLLTGSFGSSLAAERGARKSAFEKAVPEGLADLRAIERAARGVVAKASPCTVGLQVGAAQGSGVIVSPGGHVLTAAHVVGRPGREARIRLPGGTELQGKTLGIHATADAGLVKITNVGQWPYAPLVSRDQAPKVGDWCIALGHPGGFQTDRHPPVRLGRVVDVTADVVRTDCPITGGDSGGPLFDIRGRVIGIHSRIAEDLTINLHAPALACVEVWQRLEAGEIYSAEPPSRFLDLLDVTRDGKISRGELPEGLYRRVFDRLTEKLRLAPDKSHSLEDLTRALGWQPYPSWDFTRGYAPQERFRESLFAEQFTRGRAMRDAFARFAATASESTVRITCGGEPVALGTIVGADGKVLTKASQLTGNSVACTLPDGRRLPAVPAASDRASDLALLRIEARDLRPARWSDSSDLPPGSWLISAGPQGIESVGVVSVGARPIAGIPGVLGVDLSLDEDVARVARVYPNGGAARAGILPDDVIKQVMGLPVKTLDELRAALEPYRAGDPVQVTVSRSGQILQFEVTLGAAEDVFFRFPRGRLSGPLSRRRDSFPKAIQHDAVLSPTSCGGPVVDLAGRVVGVNIARADRIATYAVPADAVRAILVKLDLESSYSKGETGQK